MINIDEYFYINLDKDIKRLHNIKINLKKANIKATRFSAINGSTLNFSELIKEKIIDTDDFKTVKKGSLANMLSHTEIWKYALKKEYKYIVVFEDDCIIPINFNNILDNYKLDMDFDIFFLGGCFINGYLYNEKYIIPKIVDRYSSSNLGFFSYILNCSSINKILENLFPYKYPIDVHIRNLYSDSNLILYYTYPNIISHDFLVESSRLYIDYNIKYYSDDIINNYKNILLEKCFDFDLYTDKIKIIKDIKCVKNIVIDSNQNLLFVEKDAVLTNNYKYFIIKFINNLNNWKIIIITNKNIMKSGRSFLYNCDKTINDNLYYIV